MDREPGNQNSCVVPTLSMKTNDNASQEELTYMGGPVVQSLANNNNREPDVGLNRNVLKSCPAPLNRDGTGEYLNTLDTCGVIAETIVAPPDGSKSCSPEDPIADKGGTLTPSIQFDVSNPETWPESVRQADKELSLVMSRMKNPESSESKSKNPDLKVKLVRGHNGAAI